MAEYIERGEIFKAYEEEQRRNGPWSFEGLINSIPAADVAPVRHGRWAPEDVSPRSGAPVGWKCSKCGAISFEAPEYYPDCGARMDEEATDGA